MLSFIQIRFLYLCVTSRELILSMHSIYILCDFLFLALIIETAENPTFLFQPFHFITFSHILSNESYDKKERIHFIHTVIIMVFNSFFGKLINELLIKTFACHVYFIHLFHDVQIIKWKSAPSTIAGDWSHWLMAIIFSSLSV